VVPPRRRAGVQDSINLLVQTAPKGKSMERRLAAILAADVVGYSRLVALDEAGALATLKERRRES
jgi:adenylate cyclase